MENSVWMRSLEPLKSFPRASKKMRYLLSGWKDRATDEVFKGLLRWWMIVSEDRGTSLGNPQTPAVVKKATGSVFWWTVGGDLERMG